MALYGVLGDIHGNLEALRAVLAALDARGVRELLCVGDVVGYNADADACAALLRRRGARVILGNHDLIATRRLGFERCSNNARYALARTRRTLARESAEWLATLPERLLVDGEIRIHVDHSGQEVTLARHSSGSVVGEMSVFDDQPRSAGAQATTDTTVRVLRRDRLQAIVHEHPEVLLEFIKNLSQRLRAMDEKLGSAPPTATAATSP